MTNVRIKKCGIGPRARLCLILCRLPLIKKRFPEVPTSKKVYNLDGSFKTDFEYAEYLYQSADLNIRRMDRCAEFSLKGKNVLDIGCGDGGRTLRYADRANLTYGLDYDKERLFRALAFARKKELQKKVSFVNGSGGCLPFKDKSIDVVLMNDVMEHVPDPLKTLKESKRVLKPQGLLAIDFAGYYSRHGSHLTEWIPIPWCHLLFGQRALIRALYQLAQKEPYIYFQFPGLKKIPLPEKINDLDCGGLNMISIKHFKRYIRELDMDQLLFWRGWRIFRLPILEELMAHVYCILRKKNQEKA